MGKKNREGKSMSLTKKTKIREKDFPHLNNETKPIILLSTEEKINWAFEEHFIMYPQARKIIRDLTIIMNQPQKPYKDLISMSIIGESGTGKTAIINFIKKIHQRIINKDEYTVFPIVHCILNESSQGIKALYKRILKPFGYPMKKQNLRMYNMSELEEGCIDVLKNTEVRIIFMDEFQHANGTNIQAILNSLKTIILETGVPLVPVGTEETLKVLMKDKQIAKRCRLRSYSHLKPWKCDDVFRSFLKGYLTFLPFPERSNIDSKEISKIIFDIAFKQGTIDLIAKLSRNRDLEEKKERRIDLRNVTEVIKETSRIALLDNSPKITIEHLKTYKKEYL